MPKFSSLSFTRLRTCDDRLIDLFMEVIKTYDCSILEGHRTRQKQLEYYTAGKTLTMNSKHLLSPSQAVDVAPYPIDWDDTIRFYHFAGFVHGTAVNMDIPIRWGGDWNGNLNLRDQRFFDLVHFELRDDQEKT